MAASGGKLPIGGVGINTVWGTLVKLLALIAATALAAGPVHSEPAKVKILQSVKGFYKAFNAHDFSSVGKVTTPGWNHVNPLGGRTIGRAAVLAELKEVHSTFLRA